MRPAPALRSAVRNGVPLVFAVAMLAACADDDALTTSASAPPAASTAHPQQWPALKKPAFQDGNLEDRIARLLAEMSVEAKVGQLIQADITSVTPADVRRYRLGAVLAGGNSGPGGHDFAPAPAWLALADAYHDASMSTDGEPRIPVMWGIDAVHGHNNIIGATLFPQNVALGATGNPGLTRRIGAITAREIRVTGQEWTFAPTVAVVRDDRWGRSYESYSEDPALVAAHAVAMLEGLQGTAGAPDFLRGEHVIATVKHFLGDGGTLEGRDQGDTRSSEHELREIHGAGYLATIPAGAQAVMASYNSWQGVKLHGHAGLLNGVLKERLAFDGLVVGDWNGHGQVQGCTNTDCAASFNAGLDMFMAPDSWKGLYESTLEHVRAGAISRARLDEAVRRILRIKLRAGLFEAGKPSTRPLAGRFELLGAPEHRAVARQAVRESLVLLKNEKQLLPLQPKQRVLVAGDGADSVSKQSGGWTLSWQGTGVSPEHFPGATSIWTGIRNAVTAAGGSAELSVDGKYRTRPDAAIVVYGEDPYAEFQGDIVTLEYRPGDKRDLELLKRLRADGIPVVSVFLSGRPLWVNPEINASNAFVAAWLPGSEGGGVADLLFRTRDGVVAHDFKGKLAFSWPRTPLQHAANHGVAGESPQFAFGDGLTLADAGELPVLAEDVPREAPTAVDTRTFFAEGKPGRGWRSFVDHGDGKRVGPGDLPPALASPALELTPEDSAPREVLALRWNRPATFGLVGDTPIDLQRESNGELSLAIEYRVTQRPGGEVKLSIGCGPECAGTVPITAELAQAPVGEWRKLRVLLSCFERAGAGMRTIDAPFVMTADTLALSLGTIRLETGAEDTKRCNP